MANQIFCCASSPLLSATGFWSPTSPIQLSRHGGTYKRGPEHIRGCSQQELQLSQRPTYSPSIDLSDSSIVLSRLHHNVGRRRERSICNHLQPSSRQSYGTGYHHFGKFCQLNHVTPSLLSTWPIPDVQRFFEFFIDYLRHSRNPVLRGDTINSYTTPAAEALATSSIVPSTIICRSHNFNNMLTSYVNEDYVQTPILDRQMIPLTYSLLCDIPPLLLSMFPRSPNLQQLIMTAFCLGYCLSLRPSEYADRHAQPALSKQVLGKHSYFWFDDLSFNVCYPARYPVGLRPSLFTSLLQFRKNDIKGKGTTLATARPSVPTSSIICIDIIFDFLSQHPPAPDALILSGSIFSFSTDRYMQPVLDQLTILHGFPYRRLRPHSSIRSGVLAQINDQSDEVKRQQGGWSSNSGMMIYTRPSFLHAVSIANDIHDPSKYSTSHLQRIFGTTPSPSPI